MNNANSLPNFFAYNDFLNACERAAAPPKPAHLQGGGLLGFHHAENDIFGRFGARTFAEMNVSCAAIAPSTPLPDARSDRIATLLDWMKYFPAFNWLNGQPAVTSALTSFRRVQKRSPTNARLNDDLADVRFWRCAAWAGMVIHRHHKPSADAEQRKSAENAVRKLIKLGETTRLLDDVGLGWQQQEQFRALMSALLSIGTITKRPRSDAHSSDRDYVKSLAGAVWKEFGAVPPSIVIGLAALKVASPDKVLITKLSARRARELAAETIDPALKH